MKLIVGVWNVYIGKIPEVQFLRLVTTTITIITMIVNNNVYKFERPHKTDARTCVTRHAYDSRAPSNGDPSDIK